MNKKRLLDYLFGKKKTFVHPVLDELISLRKNDNEKYSNWKTDFYVGAILSTFGKKAEFELIFESLKSNKLDYVRFEIKKNLKTY